jgi:hypothetical protein
MLESDQEYFTRRAREEAAAAELACQELTGRLHRELAQHHALRAAAIREAQEQLGTKR